MPNRLITSSASHHCEKARWALDLAGIKYPEDAHVSGFHKRVVRRAALPWSCTGIIVNRGKILPLKQT